MEIEIEGNSGASPAPATTQVTTPTGQEVALDLSSQSSTCSSSSSVASSITSGVSSYCESKRKPYAKFNRMVLPKDSNAYKEKRDRNNDAVKKSREKSKAKLTNKLEDINKLTADNTRLNREVDILSKEVRLIRSMYTSHLRQAHNYVLPEDELITQEDAAKQKDLSM